MVSAGSKRLLDLLGSVLGLIALSPVLLAIAVLVKLRLGSPVLFRQTRIGMNGEEFRITKFRTMIDARDSSGNPLPDAERLTPLGRRLRALSFDELPELLDVLRGHMSLVGPRPLPVKYRDRYTVEQWRRHEVKPGITGWAQVNGRNALTWEEKFEHDLWYVDHHDLRTDLRILMLTVVQVAKRRGIAADGHSTMPEFFGKGNADDA